MVLRKGNKVLIAFEKDVMLKKHIVLRPYYLIVKIENGWWI